MIARRAAFALVVVMALATAKAGIAQPNTPPTASAGTAQIVAVGVVATLTAAASDPDGDTLTYAWTRLGGSGASVALTNANTAAARFTPTLGGDYSFLLTVSDGAGNTATSAVTVYATAVAEPARRWAERTVAGPNIRQDSPMAYDSARRRTVLFGGLNPGVAVLGETWEFDGTAWADRTGSPSPSVRFDHAMAYDSRRGRVVLFGGNNGSFLGDTWEWDGTSWVEFISSPSPPPRVSAALAYDSIRGRTVLFGGNSLNNDVSDTWEWSGTGWSQMATGATSPPVREQHAMSYDAKRGRTVLFGGTHGSALADTWEWDGTSWVQLSPPIAPVPRFHHSMAYDAARQRTVLTGGSDGSRFFADAFEWDGSHWAPVPVAGAAPSGRFAHALVYDSSRGRTVLFGGGNSVGLSDTWELPSGLVAQTPFPISAGVSSPTTVGTLATLSSSVSDPFGGVLSYSWTRVGGSGPPVTLTSPGSATATFVTTLGGDYTFQFRASDSAGNTATSAVTVYATALPSPTRRWTSFAGAGPPARQQSSGGFDSARRRLVLFGGLIPGVAVVGDTWEFDGTHWAQMTPLQSPSVRFDHATAYDSRRGRLVLFGGNNGSFLGDTWEWDGTSWVEFNASPSPPPRVSAALAYDSGRGRTVLFGGNSLGNDVSDTWEWSGTGWSQMATGATSPPVREQHAMSYDAKRGRTVLFGGLHGSPLADTWEWDGTNWRQATPGAAPAARSGHAMSYDAVRQTTLLFGGTDSSQQFDDALEWNGNRWAPVTLAGTPPAARSHSVFAYDPSRGRAVLAGGGATSPLGDTVELANGPVAGITPISVSATGSSQTTVGTVATVAGVASDSFGGPITYAWTRSGGTGPPVTLSGANRATATFTPPAPGDYALLLTVGDAAGNTATAVVTVYGSSVVSPVRQWVSNAGAAPGRREQSAAAFDSARGRLVLYGGLDPGVVVLSDTWEWDGAKWTQFPSVPSPGPRFQHAMAYDSNRRRVVLFGGNNGSFLGDTWEWDGAGWTKFDAHPSPQPRLLTAMAYDSARGRTVLFGGNASGVDASDTWEWSGTGWSQTATTVTSPPAREAHAMSYDAKRHRVVLFGGNHAGALNDTWEYDGTSWGQSAAIGPSARFGHGMGFDAVRQTTLLFGGTDASSRFADAFEWDGTAWGSVSQGPLAPSPRNDFAFAYDVARGRAFLFGGLDVTGALADTWELVSGQRFSAFAGSLASALPNTLVTLNGTGTDGDGDPVFYSWARAGGTGPTVSLSDPTAPTPSFTPPTAGTYTFNLTVSDHHTESATSTVTIAANTPPAVSAGTDLLVNRGTAVTLNGTATDADGDPIAISWAQTGGPAVSLSGATTLSPGFTPATAGAYTFTLTVSDNRGSTSSASVTVTVNTQPAASAGSAQTVAFGSLVTLTATASDADGDPLFYSWTRAGGDGPTVTLDNANTAVASFTPVTAGAYTFALTVTDGRGGLASSNVTITVIPAPIANAGAGATVNLGTPVTLHGSATDANGDPLTYSWTRSGGTGPTVTLAGATTLSPSFTPAVAGTYTFTLTASDGRGGLGSSTVTIAANTPPAASAGSAQTVPVSVPVSLAGSGSDADGDPLRYAWNQTGGTSVTLAGAGSAQASFSPAAIGTYTFRLTVTDGRGGAGSDDVTVTAVAASGANLPPSANAGAAQTVTAGLGARLAGSGADSDGDPLTYSWARTGGSGPTVGLSDPSSPTPTFTPAAAGTYTFQLTVTDGRGGTATSSVTVTANAASTVNTLPAASAGPDRTVKLQTVVTLAGSATDPDGDPLGYSWTRTGGTGPSVTLAGPATLTPTFAPAAAGTYAFTLTVSDGRGGIATSSVTIRADAPPVAAFTATSAASVGALIALDGRGSFDPDAGDTLAYHWSLSAIPQGSALLVSAVAPNDSTQAAQASFVPDVAGTYRVRLVADDGIDVSAPTEANVTVQARQTVPPTVSIRTQSLHGGPQTVELDGSASRGPSGLATDAVTYRWALTGAPGAAAPFASGGAVVRYGASSAGNYVFSLTVTALDGGAATTSVTIVIDNVAPAADAGPDQTLFLPRSGSPAGVPTQLTAQLDGRATADANGDPLAYRWSVIAAPDRSAADADTTTLVAFDSRAIPVPTLTFRGDLSASGQRLAAAGVYRFRVTASDGSLQGFADVAVTAIDPLVLIPRANAGIDAAYQVRFVSPGVPAATIPDPTVVPASDAAGMPLNLRPFVRLDGHESADPRGLSLSYRWTFARGPSGMPSIPAASRLSGVIGSTYPAPTFVPDVEGSYTLELIVSNGSFDSAPARVTVTIAILNHPPTAAAVVEDQARMRSATPQDALLAFTVGDRVVLRGDSSFDEDPGDQSRFAYSWQQTQGRSVALQPSTTSAVVSFIAGAQGSCSFRLSVADPQGAAGTPSEVSLLVLPRGQTAPTLTLVSSVESSGASTAVTGEDDGDSVQTGSRRSLRVTLPVRVRLTANLTPAGSRHRLTWNQVDGPTVLLTSTGETDTSSSVSRTSFSPTTSRVHVFEAVADLLDTGGRPTGLSVSRRISVIVDSAVSQVPTPVGSLCPPVVPAQANDRERTVTLDATASSGSSGGKRGKSAAPQRLSYTWRQIAGPRVVISNPAAAVTTFVMPRIGVASTRRYVFSLFVDTGRDRSLPFNLSASQQGTQSQPSGCNTTSSTAIFVQLFLRGRALSPAAGALSSDGGTTIPGVMLPGDSASGEVLTLEEVAAGKEPSAKSPVLRSYTLEFLEGAASRLVLGDSGLLALSPSIRGTTVVAVVLPPGLAPVSIGVPSGGGCALGSPAGEGSADALLWLLVLYPLSLCRTRQPASRP